MVLHFLTILNHCLYPNSLRSEGTEGRGGGDLYGTELSGECLNFDFESLFNYLSYFGYTKRIGSGFDRLGFSTSHA